MKKDFEIVFFLRIVLLLCVATTFIFTQAPDTLWTKTYGGAANDVGNSIEQTSDGGYIIVGTTESFGAGQQDVWLLKTDSSGDTIWAKTYGGYNDDWAEEVQQTIDGGYIIAANTTSFGAGGNNIWLLKTDSLGNTLWTETYDIWYNNNAHSIQQTSDGGYIVTGEYPAWDRYPFLLKTDTNGDTVWTNDFGVNSGRGASVRETFDGGYIVAGDDYLGQGVCIPWLVKMDENGNNVWSQTTWPWGAFRSVKQTLDSGYVACGFRILADHSSALCIIKTDPQGDTLWTRQYGDSTTKRSGNSVQLTNDNGYIITGACWEVYVDRDLFLFKTDETGDSLWCVTYGRVEVDCGNQVLQTNDGGYIVVGYTESYGAGGSDVWIIKTEPDVGIEEQQVVKPVETYVNRTATIFSGPLRLPEGKKYRVFDVTGQIVEPTSITRGIYFIEIDGVVTQKVVKVR